MSDRWQNEIAETVCDVVNQEADKIESKRRHRPRSDEPDEIGMIQLFYDIYIYDRYDRLLFIVATYH